MGKKIYVGNLAFSIDSEQLSGIFSEFGTVASSNVIMDRDTGRSKGFGFIEMSSDNEAQTAIEKLNGMEVGGRQLKISEAKPQEPRTGGFGGGGGGGRSRY